MKIDLNADCGESFGRWTLGDDAAILREVTSANIACGGHAGDPDVMRATVHLCAEGNVAIGAHPGYPDLQGFGRRALPMAPAEIFNSVLAQIGALHAIARAEGAALVHVKAHGALYNHAATHAPTARAIADAVAAFDRGLIFVALAGSGLAEAGRAAGLRVAEEAFADRVYEANGALRDRKLPGSMVEGDAAAAAQAVAIVRDGAVTAHGGSRVTLRADTICLHGDAPGAAARARAVRAALKAAGVTIERL